MPKPSEFFVGLLDFFAILLPGAILSAILAPRLGPFILGPLVPEPTSDPGRWVVFLVSSYFLGHLIFLAGSSIDGLYNFVRERRDPYSNTSAYQCATNIRDVMVDEHERKELNTFQWSRSVLLAKCPAAAEDVHRLEADSKFFRSSLIVCAVGAATFAWGGRYLEAAVAVMLVLPCFARYYERRLKSTTQAYIHVITLHRLQGLQSKQKNDAVEDIFPTSVDLRPHRSTIGTTVTSKRRNEMSSTTDRAEIEVLFQKLARAHADHNADAIVDAYAPDAVIFDLAPPLGRRGMNRDSVAAWLGGWDGPIQIDARDVNLTVDGDLAFVSALNRMRGRQGGEDQDMWYRTTMCLRKTSGRWRIVHDHSSVPFYMDGSYRAAVDLKA